MAIDRIGGGAASGAREELLAMIRSSQKSAPAAPARRPQAPALSSPAPVDRLMMDDRMPTRRISIYV